MSQNNIWHFSRLAYKQGAFDGMLEALGSMLKPGVSLLDILIAMEDWAAGADIDTLDAIYERIEPLLGAMANEEVMHAIKTLQDTWMPVAQKMGGMYALMNLAKGMQPLAKANINAMITILRAVLPMLPAVLQNDGRLGERVGTFLGEKISNSCRSLNHAYEHDSQAVQAFFSALFRAIDPQAFGRSAEIVTGCMLDQKPHLIRWSVKTAAGRLRKRFFGLGRGSDG